jgi:hypothetical protein
MSNMKIVSMIDAAQLATRTAILTELHGAVLGLAREMVLLNNLIAQLRRDVDKLKQEDEVPDANAYKN